MMINQDDDSDLRRLIAPAQDAKALAEVLRDPEIGGFEVKTLLDKPSYKPQTSDTIAIFSALSPFSSVMGEEY